MYTTQAIYDYSPVNTGQAKDLDQMLRKLQDVQTSPQEELDRINEQQLRRVKLRSIHIRQYQQSSIQKLSVKRRIKSLKTEVSSLKAGCSGAKPRRHPLPSQQTQEYSILCKQLEVVTRVCQGQRRRNTMQSGQILSLRNALLVLDDKLQITQSELQTHEDAKLTPESKRVKLLQAKKKKLTQIKADMDIQFREEMSNKADRLAKIQQAVIEREELQIQINQDLNIQSRIMEEIRDRSAVSPRRGALHSEDIGPLTGIRDRRVNKTQTESIRNLCNSASRFPTNKKPSEASKYRTLSQDITPIKIRPTKPKETPQSIIIDRRRSFRTPINLDPTKHQINQILRERATINDSSQPQLQRRLSLRKESLLFNSFSELKINEGKSLDVSMVESNIQRSYKGIEMVNERIVELETIREQGRYKASVNNCVEMIGNSSKNRKRNQSLALKREQRLFKPSGSETTKSDLFDLPTRVQLKGVPFEVNQNLSQSSADRSATFCAVRQLDRRIVKRSINLKSLDLDQQF